MVLVRDTYICCCSGGRLRGRASCFVGCGRGICVNEEDEVNSRKCKVMVVRKREAGVSWKIGGNSG